MQNEFYDGEKIDTQSKKRDIDAWYEHAISAGQPGIKSLIQYIESQERLSESHRSLLNKLRIKLNEIEHAEKSEANKLNEIERAEKSEANKLSKSSNEISKKSLYLTAIGTLLALIPFIISAYNYLSK